MLHLNISEIKTHLSKYLDCLAGGETIILCKRNVPIAEIRGIRSRTAKKRPSSAYKGFSLNKEFFDPLPDDVLSYFSGKNE